MEGATKTPLQDSMGPASPTRSKTLAEGDTVDDELHVAEPSEPEGDEAAPKVETDAAIEQQHEPTSPTSVSPESVASPIPSSSQDESEDDEGSDDEDTNDEDTDNEDTEEEATGDEATGDEATGDEANNDEPNDDEDTEEDHPQLTDAAAYFAANPHLSLPEIMLSGAMAHSIQKSLVKNFNSTDISSLRRVSKYLSECPIIVKSFEHTHSAKNDPLGGYCQVRVVGKKGKVKACGNGPHTGHITRYCKLHGSIGTGLPPLPAAGRKRFNICSEHVFSADRDLEIESFQLHAVCGKCQRKAAKTLNMGDSKCVCDDTLRRWNCHKCAEKQLTGWEELAEARKGTMDDKHDDKYEEDCD